MCLVCVILGEQDANKFSEPVPENDCHEPHEHQDKEILYFAVGSMCNPVSLRLRALTPLWSQPAVLKNWKLCFKGSGGMASAEPCQSKSTQIVVDVEHKEHSVECATDSHVSNVSISNNDQLDFDHCIHGVLHHLSRQQMAVLDRIEGGYIRRLCNVSLYNTPPYVDQAIPPTATRQAYVYQMDPVKLAASGKGDNLPQERYLDIVARGCQNFGVRPEWIQWINNQKCLPRKSPLAYDCFSMSSTVMDSSLSHINHSSLSICGSSSVATLAPPVFTWAEIELHTGLAEADREDLWIVINQKVIKFVGDVTSFFPFGYFTKHKIGGTDYTLRFARGYYEPLYCMPEECTTDPSSLELEHQQWIEDQFKCPPPSLASSKWIMVGVTDGTLPTSLSTSP